MNYVVDLPFGRGKRFLATPGTLGGKSPTKSWVVGHGRKHHVSLRQFLRLTEPTRIGGSPDWPSNGNSERPRFAYPRIPYDNGVSGHTP